MGNTNSFESVGQGIAWTIQAMERVVVPVLKPYFDATGFSLERYEGSPLPEHRALDLEACTDYGVVKRGTGARRGLMARVQSFPNYETSTLRCWRSTGGETEFEKLLRRREQGLEIPAWHLQAYVSKDLRQFYRLGVLKVEAILDYVSSGRAEKRSVSGFGKREEFFVIPWAEIPATGKRLLLSPESGWVH
jgi:hypothetical protein